MAQRNRERGFVDRAIEAKGVALAAILILVVSIAVWEILRYGTQVRNEIEGLAIANSDSQQWSLAQLEVEFDQMRIALLQVDDATGAGLDAFVQRFDVFYSRVSTVTDGNTFGNVRTDERIKDQLRNVTAFTQDTARIVDAGDDVLRSELDVIEMHINALAVDVRAISLQGVREFSEVAKAQRERVYESLLRLGVVAVVLVSALSFGIFGLWWLWQFGARQTRSLRSAKLRLESVINTALDAVIVVDCEGRVLEYNPAAERIFGFSAREMCGNDFAEMIVPDHLREGHHRGFRRYRETGEASLVGMGLVQMEALRKSGEIFLVEMSISSVQLGHKEVFVSYMRDITDRVAAEQELISTRDKAMESERAKAAFVAVMSHEMRTPLNGLLGTLENLKSTPLTDHQKRHVSTMEQSGAILLGHVNDVLDVEKLESGMFDFAHVPFSALDLAQRACDTIGAGARERGNQVTAVSEGDVPPAVIGDPNRILQILINLVSNANRFTTNGEVQVEVEYHRRDGELEFRVVDTGVGIPEADLERVFDDFVTVGLDHAHRESGTGLGLGIARRLVRGMKGEIGVESDVGEGSVFWFRIPAAAGETATWGHAVDPGLLRPAGQPATSLRILVVEDNAINREVLTEMLMTGGHSSRSVVNGQEAVELTAHTPFDVILMDLNMPVLDGRLATRAIRSSLGPNRQTPIIAVTANASPRIAQELRGEGFTDAIMKPITLRRLAEVLTVHTGERIVATPSEPCVEGLDLSVLAELCDILGPERVAHTCEQFMREGHDQLAQLREARDAGDVAGYQQTAHKFAGAAALVGALELRTSLQAHDANAALYLTPPYAAKLDQVAQVFAQTRSAISRYLDRLPAA